MRLESWHRAGTDVDFDPSTGSARAHHRDEPRPPNEHVAGFAAFERSLLSGRRAAFAVHRSGDARIFRAGLRSWRLGRPEITLHHWLLPFIARFQVRESGRVVYSLWYEHSRRTLLALRDPTYDLIDEDADYFLAFLARAASDPGWCSSAEPWTEPREGAQGDA